VQDKPCVNQPVPFINGGFFAIRRRVYEQLGGFPLFFQGWGHEDRYLSMVAGLLGFRCMVNQSLVVQHLYKAVFAEPPSAPLQLPEPYADPLPADGIQPSIQSSFAFAIQPEDRSQQLLMNSLRFGELLYSNTVKQSLKEQLLADYGEERVARGLAAIEAEQPQLNHYRQLLGLDDAARDAAMEGFFDHWSPYLPMLAVAELQLVRALPPAEALSRIQQLPRELNVLHGDDAEQFTIARLYLEASFAYSLGDWSHVITCLSEVVSLNPDYLPALRMLTIALRTAGRQKAYRHWLEHASVVIERHQATYGPGPIGAWHPANNNTYLRNLYWIEVDRSIWRDLSDLHAAAGDRDEAARWLGKLLSQTPGEPDLLQCLTDVYSDNSDPRLNQAT
jgi:tetratricopeptide (TPR) repeat protein